MSYAIPKSVLDDVTSTVFDPPIDPALLLTVISVETGGQPYEADGVTPTILCEPAQFYRFVPSNLRAQAVAAGLATRAWDPRGYKDQGTSAGRLARFARMKEVDETAAYMSISMGLPQVMGFNHAIAGYASAREMFDAFSRGGVREMLAAMVRLLPKLGVAGPLTRHDWSAAARAYNGAGYRKNAYDVKLAAAFAHWKTALASGHTTPPDDGSLGLGSDGDAVKKLQADLTRAGYPVRVDGVYGPKVHAAVAAFQAANGLPGTGQADHDTLAALAVADPAPQGARELATSASLAGSSRIVGHSRAARKLVVGAGLLDAASSVDPSAALDGVTGTLDKIDAVKSAASRTHELWQEISAHLPSINVSSISPHLIGLLALGLLATLYLILHRIEHFRAADERQGATI